MSTSSMNSKHNSTSRSNNNNNNNSNDTMNDTIINSNTPGSRHRRSQKHHGSASSTGSAGSHASSSGFMMMNPRNLWQRWRTNRLTPRFRRRGQLDEDDNRGDNDGNHMQILRPQECAPDDAMTFTIQQQQKRPVKPETTKRSARAVLLQEHPPSPVANEAALQELMMSASSIHSSDDATNDDSLSTPQPQFPGEPLFDTDEMSQFSLTPPACAVLPFMVSAKKHSLQIRSKHSAKRRRRRSRPHLNDQTNTILSNNDGATDNTENVTTSTMMAWRDDEENGDNGCGYAFSSDDDTVELNEELEAWNRETSKYSSPAERTQHFWEICYGSDVKKQLQKNGDDIASWSAQRVAPKRSCLSSTKARRKSLPAMRRRDSHRSPMLPPKGATATELLVVCETPSSAIIKGNIPSSSKRKVQFGALSAAEYERDEPPSSAMKPLREDELMRYSLEQKEVPPEEEAMVKETKTNSLILAEWDGAFDDDSDNDAAARKRRRRSSNVFSPNAATNSLVSDLSSPPMNSNNNNNNNEGYVDDYEDALVDRSSSGGGNCNDDIDTPLVVDTDDSLDEDDSYGDENCTAPATIVTITQDDDSGSSPSSKTSFDEL